MSSLASILDGARRALNTHQLALGVTGHNIENVNTEGYRRQRAVLVADQPMDRIPGQIGSGVRTLTVEQLRSDFLDRQVLGERSDLSRSQVLSQGLQLVDSVMMEPGEEGLGAVLDRFWAGWQDVANEPDSLAARRVLLETGSELQDRIRQLDHRLDTAREDQDQRIPSLVSRVNQISATLADLNDRIQDARNHGSSPNDLLDRRDMLVDELAGIADVQVYEEENGLLRVVLGSLPVVEGVHHQELEVRPEQDDHGEGLVNRVYWARTGTPLQARSGELAAIEELRDGNLPGLRQRLDRFVSSLVQSLNSTHQSGSDLQGRTGQAFFDPEGLTAASLALELQPGEGEARVAVSADSGTANGEIALEIAALATRADSRLGGLSLEAFYGELVAEVGFRSREASQNEQAHTSFLAALEEQRQSLTGVNLDEEMAELMIQQQAYQAAGRLVNVVDEMMQTLLGLV